LVNKKEKLKKGLVSFLARWTMTFDNVARQRISDAMDGEATADGFSVALSDLKSADAREAWDVYHRIGDLLRSRDLDVGMSADFAARMSARLEAEPAIVAPVHAVHSRRLRIRRIALPGALAAAAATVAFVATPQLMVAFHGASEQSRQLAVPAVAELAPVAASANRSRSEAAVRDQNIDEYLIAHQRFSPSIYSSTQYARPATFANGTTGK
jgi:sigma-E factor negative regulatory protein RseA